MNHRQYKEMIDLLLYDELSQEDRAALDDHVRACAECRGELEEVRRLQGSLPKGEPGEVDNRLLQEARLQLRRALNAERHASTPWRDMLNSLGAFFTPRTGFVLGGVLTLAGGILIGRLWVPQPEVRLSPEPTGQLASGIRGGSPEISNVKFVTVDPEAGTVEFTFDTISPVHIKGNITDPRIQEVLARTMVSDRNPGVRLRSANVLSSQAQRMKVPDREVKKALIHALRGDSNPAVRKEAMKTLLAFPFDDEVKQAFLFVLVHDGNPAMRIAAINSLDSARVQDQPADNDLLEVLKERMHSDNNNYVRIKAKSVLEEAKQP